MDNRKNTILLTVIAVATLLVAVVGATFAYFTAQGGGKRQTNVQVTTSTSSSSTIQVNGSMTVHADQTTFGKDAAAHVTTPEATANISWTPSNAAAGSDLNFCYSVELQVTGNDFEYADADFSCSRNSGSKPVSTAFISAFSLSSACSVLVISSVLFFQSLTNDSNVF